MPEMSLSLVILRKQKEEGKLRRVMIKEFKDELKD